MLRLADERHASASERGAAPLRPLRVVSDQTGCPTWTGHLAPALLGLIEREVRGVVHLAGSGYTSWHGFAREIFRQLAAGARGLTLAKIGEAEVMARGGVDDIFLAYEVVGEPKLPRLLALARWCEQELAFKEMPSRLHDQLEK